MLPTLLVVSALLAAPASLPDAAGPVHAVLFYSPTCPHCHEVMEEDLPPLLERWGELLVLATVDVSTPRGQALYGAAVEAFRIPRDRIGVPTLVVGRAVLVGAGEIPARFPALVEEGVAGGGVGWPAVPGLARAVQDGRVGTGLLRPETTVAERFLRDPVANTGAVLVLVLLLAALARGALRVREAGVPTTVPGGPWIPALLATGLGVSAYLAWVEVTGSEAVCGPVGDCNAVQQSPWARLFGVLPVGVAGVAGYAALAGAWAAARRAHLAETRRKAAATTWMLAFAGTAFSAWLTFLEPFVIGATCAWCLTSALVVAALLTAATGRPASDPAGSPRRSRAAGRSTPP